MVCGKKAPPESRFWPPPKPFPWSQQLEQAAAGARRVSGDPAPPGVRDGRRRPVQRSESPANVLMTEPREHSCYPTRS